MIAKLCALKRCMSALKLSLPEVREILNVSQKPATPLALLSPLTQSAASMVKKLERFSTYCPPVDKLLSGGLMRGHVLEVSGPPGTPKELVAMNIARSFVENNEGVLFVGTGNSLNLELL